MPVPTTYGHAKAGLQRHLEAIARAKAKHAAAAAAAHQEVQARRQAPPPPPEEQP